MNGAVFANQDTSHAVHVEIRAFRCTNQDVVFIRNVDNAFLFVNEDVKKVVRLFEYSIEAVLARVPGKLEVPTTMTPLSVVITSP